MQEKFHALNRTHFAAVEQSGWRLPVIGILKEAVMGCLFILMAGFFPRIADILLWLARPEMFTRAFNGSWFWPMLGVIFLPFTTLFYVFMWTPTGLAGWDWLWISLAVVMDLMNWATSARKAQTDYMPSSTDASAAA